MTIEKRKSSWALKCDCPYCHIELIRRTKKEVLKEANDEKWSVKKDYHECYDCISDNCPGEAIAKNRYGQSSHTVITDSDVKAGDVVTSNGNPAGIAKSSASAGDPVEASLVQIPSQQVAPDDDVIKGSSIDENGDPKVVGFSQGHGDTIPGVTAKADRSSIADKAKALFTKNKKSKKPLKAKPAPEPEPEINQENLKIAARLFGEVDYLLGDSNGESEKLN